jgi:hypothetical protein
MRGFAAREMGYTGNSAGKYNAWFCCEGNVIYRESLHMSPNLNDYS